MRIHGKLTKNDTRLQKVSNLGMLLSKTGKNGHAPLPEKRGFFREKSNGTQILPERKLPN